jgi:hypothetical protein
MHELLRAEGGRCAWRADCRGDTLDRRVWTARPGAIDILAGRFSRRRQLRSRWQLVFENEPACICAAVLLSESERLSGHPARALEILEVAMRVHPLHPALMACFGSALQDVGRIHEALDVWYKLQEAQGSHPEVQAAIEWCEKRRMDSRGIPCGDRWIKRVESRWYNNNDCAIACIAMLTGRSYEEAAAVARATCKLPRWLLGWGLHIYEIVAVISRLGFEAEFAHLPVDVGPAIRFSLSGPVFGAPYHAVVAVPLTRGLCVLDPDRNKPGLRTDYYRFMDRGIYLAR